MKGAHNHDIAADHPTSGKRILLEICIASVDGAITAQQSGANRLELNSGLLLGGLTPSLGMLIETRRAVDLPLIVMIRPRESGFCYSDAEFRVMQRDMELALEHGADGVALGILTDNGQLDVDRCKQLIRQAADRQVVFHRAFDVVADPLHALEQLVDLGVTRVMTSGQEATAYDGAGLIAELIGRGAGRIEVLPAGGITRFTIADVLARTGCDQVHASLSMQRTDNSCSQRPQVSFGSSLRPAEDRYRTTSAEAVSQLREMLGQA